MCQIVLYFLLAAGLVSLAHVDIQMVVVQSDTEERLYLDNYTAHTTFLSWFQEESYSRIRDGLYQGLCRLKQEKKIALFKMSAIKYTTLQLFLALASGDYAYTEFLIEIVAKHNKTSHETLLSWLESNFELSEDEMYAAVKNYAHMPMKLKGTQSIYFTKFLMLLSNKHFLLNKAVREEDLSTSKWMIENQVSSISPESVELLWFDKKFEILDGVLLNSKNHNNTYLSNLVSSLISDELFIEYVIKRGLTHVVKSYLQEKNFNKCLILSVALERNKTEVLKLLECSFKDHKSLCSSSSSIRLLHSSVFAGRIDYAKQMLNSGTSVDSLDTDGYSLLFKALIANKTDAVKFLTKSGANCNLPIRNGRTPLSFCINMNRIDCIRKLLNMGANPHLPDFDGLTPLDFAISKTDTELLNIFIRRWGNVNEITLRGASMLHHAIVNGTSKVTRTLLEHGSDANTFNQKGETPLILATKLNDTIKILYLIEYGAEINAKDKNGNAPLHIAVEGSTYSVVKVLSILGADVRATNNKGESPLYIAVRTNNYVVIPYLLTKGANLEQKIENGGTLLHLAAIHDSVDAFKTLVNSNLSLNITSNSNETPLFVAVRLNKPQIVALIASKSGNVNEMTKEGNTLLHVAVEKGSVETMIELLKLGQNPYALNHEGKSPLTIAILKNDFSLIKELLSNVKSLSYDVRNLILASSYGCINSLKAMKLMWDKYDIDFHKADWRTGFTPLTEAVKRDKSKTVKYLREVGADLQFKSRNDDSLIHIASEWGSLRVLKLLIEWGIGVDDINEVGETPLWLATKGGHLGVMKLLKKNEANIKIRSIMEPWENGSLLHAAAYSGNPEAISWILSNNLDVDDSDLLGVTALQVAAEFGHVEAAIALLDAGATIDVADVTGLTSLHKAIFNDHNQMTKTLLVYGAELNPVTVSDFTPLHQAASRGNNEIVRMLMEIGAERDLHDGIGWTPLHWASYKGHLTVVTTLLQLGFNISLENNNGLTAYDLANERNNLEIVKLINVWTKKSSLITVSF